ncbi:PhoH family protein [Vibrio mediterranei]|uniref:PhoH family protein n=1 Tax=Vibrio mediterranei TaxID=689 RepID=UPI004068FF2F
MKKKIFILDTCVLLNDPYALYQMGEHDVGLCAEVLNELDRIKDSKKEASYEARQVIREIYHHLGEHDIETIRNGVSLGKGLGDLILLSHAYEWEGSDAEDTGDNAIIKEVLKEQNNRTYQQVVLVTRDMNMNLRAKMSGVLHVEDYRSDRVEKTEALDDTGLLEFEGSVWDLFESVPVANNVELVCQLKNPSDAAFFVLNRYLEIDEKLLRVKNTTEEGLVTFETVIPKESFGIRGKNVRQEAGLDALLNPEIGLVTLSGAAGCGKTLLAISAALEQTSGDNPLYDRIVIVRNTPPIAEENGFLPGSEVEKMMPYLQGALDSLSVLGAENNKETLDYMIEQMGIEFKSMNTMRGASVYRTFLIIEEAQNANNNMIKAMITRLGDQSKVVLTGNLNSSQIDSSYCTPYSNGLIRTIEVFANHPAAAHVQLQGGMRGDIATFAEERM